MPSRNLSDLCPEIIDQAKAFVNNCKAKGIDVIITCTYRSPDEQNQLYAQGRDYEGKIVTHAMGGQSPHNVERPDKTPAAMAFDFVPLWAGKCVWDSSDPLWSQCSKIGKDLGLEWGGDWPQPKTDNPHFQVFNWQIVRRNKGYV